MSDVVKKTKVVPFINTGTKTSPTWTQIKKSTSFTLSMNPQTKTYDFISSETPQTEIDGYQPSLSQSLQMFKGEPDYEVIFNMFYNRVTGEAAHRDALVVFYKEAGSKDSYSLTTDTEINSSKTYYGLSGGVYTPVTNPEEGSLSSYYEKSTIPIYKAWKIDALITINQLDSVNENIDFDLAFNEIVNGAVEVVSGSPVFTEGEWIDGDFSAA